MNYFKHFYKMVTILFVHIIFEKQIAIYFLKNVNTCCVWTVDKSPDPLAWLFILFGKGGNPTAWDWWCHRLWWCGWWWFCWPNWGWDLTPVSCWITDCCAELEGTSAVSSSASVICKVVSPETCSLLLLLSRSESRVPLLFNRVNASEFVVPSDAPSPIQKTLDVILVFCNLIPTEPK